MKHLILLAFIAVLCFQAKAQIKIVLVNEVKVNSTTVRDYCIVFSRDNHSPVDTINDTADRFEPTLTNFTIYPLTFDNYKKALDFKNKNLHDYKDCINYNRKISLRNEGLIKQRDGQIASIVKPVDNRVVVNKAKLKLTQYILSCESIYYSILQTSDPEERNHLADIGTRYYNQAYQAWISLQSTHAQFIPELNKSIPTILMMFEKLFREKENIQNWRGPLAMEFLNGELIQNILPKVWNVK